MVVRLPWSGIQLTSLQEYIPQPHDACVRQRQASFEYECVERLHELHVPTVILHGKKDKTVPYELAEEMHAAIHASKMVPFEGGHSFFFLRERQQFLDAVAAFLEISMA